MPRIEYVEELTPTSWLLTYPVITRVLRTPRWESRLVTVGATVEKPTPIFTVPTRP
jgi:methionyl-tRNA synthetase